MRSRAFTILLFLIALPAAPVTPSDAVQSVLARMDKAASEFKSMTARGTYVTHTDVINENSTETGTVVMKKVQPGEVQGLIEFPVTGQTHLLLRESAGSAFTIPRSIPYRNGTSASTASR